MIERYPEIYGKYWNKTLKTSAIGFGGTIPWECCHCHETGLINSYMETYSDVFEETIENK